MITKEELVNTYIKYSSDITEEIFNKIIDKLESLGFEKCGYACDYLGFKNYGYISFNKNSNIQTSTYVNNDEKELQVSDILENNQFEVGKWYSFYWNWGSGYDIVAKVSELGEVVGFDNFINITQGGHLDQNFNAIRLTEIENIKELTLEEVQQYLPDGHPDKIVKEKVKPIKKWNIGSYIVFRRNDTVKNVLLNKPYKIEKATIKDHIEITNESGYFDSTHYTSGFYDIEWFSTLAEAEVFLKSLLELKPLTVDDLIEGEIYYWQPKDNSYDWWIRYCSNSGTSSSNLKISHDYFSVSPGTLYSDIYIISKATMDQIKYLKVCEKQYKFIEQSELNKYDDEGNLLKVKQTFEFNKWYKSNNVDGLFFIQSKNTGYGFRSNHVNYWFTNNADFEWNIDGLEPASSEEVSERLLNYAKEKYPVGTKFKSIAEDTNYIVDGSPVNWASSNWPDGIGNFGFGMLYGKGQWADVISKPESKESKEMQLSDLKNPIFNIGDKVRVIADSLGEFNSSWFEGNKAKYKKGYEGLITRIDKNKSLYYEVNTWYYLDDNSLNAISCNLLELVEPVKKEFDRDWYVEVNSQEEADLVFQYLESVGEKLGDAFDKKWTRTWKYVIQDNNKWICNGIKNSKLQKQLSDILPNYKQKCEVCEGKGGETRDGFCDPCSECEGEGYIENDIIKPPIPPTKQIPEIEAVTNRFKASPIRKRSLPEIY